MVCLPLKLLTKPVGAFSTYLEPPISHIAILFLLLYIIIYIYIIYIYELLRKPKNKRFPFNSIPMRPHRQPATYYLPLQSYSACGRIAMPYRPILAHIGMRWIPVGPWSGTIWALRSSQASARNISLRQLYAKVGWSHSGSGGLRGRPVSGIFPTPTLRQLYANSTPLRLFQ